MNVRRRLALAVLPLALAAPAFSQSVSPALLASASLTASPAITAPAALRAFVPSSSPAPGTVLLRADAAAPAGGIPQRASSRRRQRGVPQYVYTALVVGMSALTIGLGVDAALDSRAGRAN